MGNQQKIYSTDHQSGSTHPGIHPQAGNPSGSVIRSYTPSGPPPLTPGSSTPVIPSCSTPGLSPKPSPVHSAQVQAAMAAAGVLNRHGGGSNSGSNSPVPSAFKGTSRSGTPCVSSLVVQGSAQAALARSFALSHPSGSPQVSLSSPVALSGLQALSSSPAPSHYPGLSTFPALSSSLPQSSIPASMATMPPTSNISNHPPTSIYQGLAHSAAPSAASPFGLGLTSAPSIFPGLPPGPSPTGFPGLGVSGGHGAGSPVLSSFMGLPGATPSSVASVAPLQAVAAAAAAAAGVPSSSPVLPGFASAFSSSFQPGVNKDAWHGQRSYNSQSEFVNLCCTSQTPVNLYRKPEGAGSLGCIGWFIVILSGIFTIALFPITIWFCVKIVQEYERTVIFRLGRITDRKAKGPGIFFILPCTDSFVKVDLRTVSFDIPPQEILTKDSVTVSVDGVVYFRVSDPIASVANVSNADFSTRLLAQTTLRNVLGTKNLSELLSDREGIAHSMQSNLDEATDNWGIKVERVEIKDVKLPHQLQRAMAAEAEASREARAKVIAAEGEMNASRALKEASLVIAESPSALQLRYLQTLNTIAAEKNSTIIFPLPMDVLSHFMRK
ncbi:Erythrocyte band 7 integral membrane protein [Nibea albiflora]|uniref:Erythrocyte band 7 integral membrane protein n=1 Tax=Nibea albiflora TaxID=240163 RepID=A0ACB7F0L8_NIBAL|nr:Erythrocyte band 7 integral membrane protein [Nibea albiflora]